MPKRAGKKWKARNGRLFSSYKSAKRSDRTAKKGNAAQKATRKRNARRKKRKRR